MKNPQYPYDLFLRTVQGGSINEKGNPVPGETVWIDVSDCRDEQSAVKEDLGPDGVSFTFTAMIYAPKSCPVLTKGDTIQVKQGDLVRLEETVKNFSKDLFHCRIWV